jgi:hypothetical protein
VAINGTLVEYFEGIRGLENHLICLY